MPATTVLLLIVAGCARSPAPEPAPAPEPPVAQAPAETPVASRPDPVVARLGTTPLRLSEASAMAAGALFELEHERYRVLQHAVETRLLVSLAAVDAPSATAKILLEPPRPPAVTLDGEPAALRTEQGAVTVTVFCDYASPHCASLQPLLADLTTLYPGAVRIAARDLPLSIHPHAPAAAEAARCAGEQGRYWAFHDLAWARGGTPDPESLEATVAASGLDLERHRACMSERRHAAAVEADVARARRLGLDAVPAVFVDGQRAVAPVTIDSLVAMVEDSLARAGAAPPPVAVVPPSKLPLQLRATIVGPRVGLGLAVFSDPAQPERRRTVREGERVTAEAILRRVGERSADLLVNGRLERVALIPPDAPVGPLADTAIDASARPRTVTSGPGAMPVYLDRETVRARMSNRVELATHLAPVPMTVDGYRLVQLRDVPAGSLYELLGLQPGDVVVAVNERPIHEGDNPLWDALDREREVRVRVMRRGGLAQHYTYRFD